MSNVKPWLCVAPLQKCAEYWPEDSVTHEGIEIKVVTVTQEDDYSLRVFTLKVRLIADRHIQYTSVHHCQGHQGHV